MLKFNYKNITGLLPVLLFFIVLSSCDDSEKGFGEPCDQDTVCKDVCNLGLPDGMCTSECSEENPCKSGVCTDFGEHSYCLPSCEQNEDCREGYSCIDFKCAPLQPLGAQCDDTDDCLACGEQENCPDKQIECKESVCSVPCSDQNDCLDGTVCAKTDGEYWCIGIYFQQGDGTAGETCPAEGCAEGFECFDDPNSNELPYCTNSCVTSEDCPPDMTCRDNGTDGNKWCVLRTFCEECDLDSQCGFEQDKCIGVIDQNGDVAEFCSMQCDPQMEGTCPMDSTCKEAMWCQDKNTWVDDCSNCPGECNAASPSVYQCFKDFGTCTGNGENCTPCHSDSDCADNLHCKAISSDNKVCVAECAENDGCPDGFMCNQFDGLKLCIPRTLSCDNPSGTKDTCDVCIEWSDCLRGGCFNIPGETGGLKRCLDFCINQEDCTPYASCETVTRDDGAEFSACVPLASVGSCENWQDCTSQCPDGPSECTNPPSYCQ